jgi:ABC-type antimicrobial peptide transport system permease subunit
MRLPFTYSSKSLFVRKTTTLVTIFGISLVSFVYAAVLMLSSGIEETLVQTGSPKNAIIVQRSSISETTSTLTREHANILKSFPGIALTPEGELIATPEAMVLVNLAKKNTTDMVNAPLRGTLLNTFDLRPGIKMIEGRVFQPGTSEIIVGAAARRNYENCDIGDEIFFGKRYWKVVGIFDAGRTGFDSEIWGDVEQFMQAFRRPLYSSMTVQIPDNDKFKRYQELADNDKRLRLDVKRESQFYADQSENLAGFIRILGTVVTTIFSIGAIIGAMITMYAAVANRTREIGTLQALGFSRKSILSGFLIESLLLAVIGGLIGLVVASFLTQFSISTTNFDSFSEMEFRFSLTLDIVQDVLIFSLFMGFTGGFLPAVRAARLKVVDALRNV